MTLILTRVAIAIKTKYLNEAYSHMNILMITQKEKKMVKNGLVIPITYLISISRYKIFFSHFTKK